MQDYRGILIADSAKKQAARLPDGQGQRVAKKNLTANRSPLHAISKTMIVSDIIAILPEAESVVAEYGLHCFSCAAGSLETLEEGCVSHGFDDEEIDELVDDLNNLLSEKPSRPQMIEIAPEGARAAAKVLEEEGRPTAGLTVVPDGHGGFCMEFCDKPADGALIFSSSEVPTLQVSATPLVLSRIGGARIDFRDGRFKLDLPEDTAKHSCACGGKCKSDGGCGCGGNCSCKH